MSSDLSAANHDSRESDEIQSPETENRRNELISDVACDSMMDSNDCAVDSHDGGGKLEDDIAKETATHSREPETSDVNDNEDDDDGIDISKVVFDKFGFFNMETDYHQCKLMDARVSQLRRAKERYREKKWMKMFLKWDFVKLNRLPKLTRRVKKGYPL